MLKYLFAAILILDPSSRHGSQLRFCLRVDPKTFQPLTVEDEASETIRYLTGGFLIQRNRLTQELEGDLASSWLVSERGRRIDFQLRPNLLFSDGTPFSCEDVAYTIRTLMDPALHSPTGDSFRSGPGAVETGCTGRNSAMARFPAPVAALAAQFDQVAIMSARSSHKEPAVMGPFCVREYRPGSYVLLERNPNYWKRDASGKKLPYLSSIRLDILQNRELELLRFRRGELDIINKLDPEMYDRLAGETSRSVVDSGPSLDWESIFFNQVARSPIPAHKLKWFRSSAFRRAISEAINRDDICRIAYRGHAHASVGLVSVSNHAWLNTALKPPSYSIPGALQRLEKDGFHLSRGGLVDREGHPVEFSMITNSGNKQHERMLALIQQDLARIGIHLNLVILDFSSLIDRISRSFDYESCLMAFSNIDIDPNEEMNIWLSSANNHQWNPAQKKPETQWEARIDDLMREQKESLDNATRKRYFDQVQQIVSDEAPMLFLVNPNALSAVSPNLRNVEPAVLRPQVFWNADRLYIGGTLLTSR